MNESSPTGLDKDELEFLKLLEDLNSSDYNKLSVKQKAREAYEQIALEVKLVRLIKLIRKEEGALKKDWINYRDPIYCYIGRTGEIFRNSDVKRVWTNLLNDDTRLQIRQDLVSVYREMKCKYLKKSMAGLLALVFQLLMKIEFEETHTNDQVLYMTGLRRELSDREIDRIVRYIDCGSSKTTTIAQEMNSRKKNSKRIGDNEKSQCPFCFKDYQSGRGIKIHKLKCKEADR